MKTFDVAIIGAGIVGAPAACTLPTWRCTAAANANPIEPIVFSVLAIGTDPSTVIARDSLAADKSIISSNLLGQWIPGNR